ncbi:MAG: TonB-dependent receptor, partial [Geminicoccaceae bacterium]|nr:TonB-dependent receptor [Geminicoccaceae bacterium]
MPATKASPIGNDPPCARALLALAALATLAALLPVRAGEAAEPCEPSVGRIVSLQGLVEVQPAGAADWARAGLNDRLCIGDTIRAGAYSQAAVALANDSVASLDQLTTMRFVGETESGRSWLDLLFGDVHLFSHRPRALEVDTPIANAFTEGTEFLVRARPERTEVILLDGRVRLASAEGEVLLASGDRGVAVAGAAPRREIFARPRDAVAWALYYPPILAPLAESAPAPSLPAGLQRAVERVAANDYAGALAALDAMPDAARDARYYSYRAGVLLNVGRVDEAAAALERALAKDPEAAEALAERAVIAVVQNREEA